MAGKELVSPGPLIRSPPPIQPSGSPSYSRPVPTVPGAPRWLHTPPDGGWKPAGPPGLLRNPEGLPGAPRKGPVRWVSQAGKEEKILPTGARASPLARMRRLFGLRQVPSQKLG